MRPYVYTVCTGYLTNGFPLVISMTGYYLYTHYLYYKSHCPWWLNHNHFHTIKKEIIHLRDDTL